MQKLLTLPRSLVHKFYEIENISKSESFVCSDPVGQKVGSGGGTAYLLYNDWKQRYSNKTFSDYLGQDKRIIIHAGGQSRRLPAYAMLGKILTPIPVFRWGRGQRFDQNLLHLQSPLYEQFLDRSSKSANTLIASGDVLIHAPKIPQFLPDVDILCFGLWTDSHLASRHGVFFTTREKPTDLDFMLQKPMIEEIEKYSSSHLFMMDIGVWLLSDKAIQVLMNKCGWDGRSFENKVPGFYDLYGEFGVSLGKKSTGCDSDINKLSVAVMPLEGGEFYHYGTSRELISSTEKIQNRVLDQRSILHHRVKPHPSLFVQNSVTKVEWTGKHENVWIENSFIGDGWTLNSDHIITGVPENNWQIEIPQGISIDLIPVAENKLCIRTYHIDDRFNGNPSEYSTIWMGISLRKWCELRKVENLISDSINILDIQDLAMFPVVECDQLRKEHIEWMISGENVFTDWYNNCEKISANQISEKANLKRLFEQRIFYRNKSIQAIYKNSDKSVFYQCDLKHAAKIIAENQIQLQKKEGQVFSEINKIKDAMFHSEIENLVGGNGKNNEIDAFGLLQKLILNHGNQKVMPQLNVYNDQIVWGRSPVRLDFAGGWSDTPPFCIENGGNVVNAAVNLNGQPPLQAFVRLSSENKIVLRSIDNGVSEEINNWDELGQFNAVGSAFSIPKAALCLAGFHPDFCSTEFSSLKEQFSEFGGGIEISMLAAVPKGSGLGTSSILAATILGAISDFCALGWDKNDICYKTLLLEQLLTTGGGWQDQFGGVFGGIKLLESEKGLQDHIGIKWISDRLFQLDEVKHNWLLYYTGVTRIAKNILSDIVRGMFLNEGIRLEVVNQIKAHAHTMHDALQRNDFERVCRCIKESWRLNNKLDLGTNTPEISKIIDMIDEFASGYKLLGAGGGGYMLIAAKNFDCASQIRKLLNENPPNRNARFVDFEINSAGLQVTRS